METIGRNRLVKVLYCVLPLVFLVPAGGCAKKGGPESAVREFLKASRDNSPEPVSKLVNLESLFPVYDGERVDPARTKEVCAQFGTSLVKWLADRDRAFWGSAERSIDKVEPQDDGSVMVTVKDSGGTSSARFILRVPPGEKGEYRIHQIQYRKDKNA